MIPSYRVGDLQGLLRQVHLGVAPQTRTFWRHVDCLDPKCFAHSWTMVPSVQHDFGSGDTLKKGDHVLPVYGIEDVRAEGLVLGDRAYFLKVKR